MGPHRSDLLEATFGVLFKMSLEIPILLRNRKLFAANKEMKQELGFVYVDMLLIVADVTIHYNKTDRGNQPDSHCPQLMLIDDLKAAPRMIFTIFVDSGLILSTATKSKSTLPCGPITWSILPNEAVSP